MCSSEQSCVLACLTRTEVQASNMTQKQSCCLCTPVIWDPKSHRPMGEYSIFTMRYLAFYGSPLALGWHCLPALLREILGKSIWRPAAQFLPLDFPTSHSGACLGQWHKKQSACLSVQACSNSAFISLWILTVMIVETCKNDSSLVSATRSYGTIWQKHFSHYPVEWICRSFSCGLQWRSQFGSNSSRRNPFTLWAAQLLGSQLSIRCPPYPKVLRCK